MIEYINTQLNRWATWCSTGHTRLGYPRAAAFMAPMLGGSGRPPALPDDDGLQIQRAVSALEPEQRTLVTLYYIKMRNCQALQIAQELRVSRDTLYTRLHRAHLSIMDHLQQEELAASHHVHPCPSTSCHVKTA